MDIDERMLVMIQFLIAIKCPKCGCYNYNVDYVDPLFNTEYGRAKHVGGHSICQKTLRRVSLKQKVTSHDKYISW